MYCYGCGVEKDLKCHEVYPYPEDGITEELIGPMLVIECCQRGESRACVICHECFHKLQPDQWINRKQWDGLSPEIPYERLPELLLYGLDKTWMPQHYPILSRQQEVETSDESRISVV